MVDTTLNPPTTLPIMIRVKRSTVKAFFGTIGILFSDVKKARRFLGGLTGLVLSETYLGRISH
jgi:hypothetical protein